MCFKIELMCFVFLSLQLIFCKTACKCFIGHVKTAFVMANGHFAMVKHLVTAENIGSGQPFFIILQWKNCHGKLFFKDSTKTFNFIILKLTHTWM